MRRSAEQPVFFRPVQASYVRSSKAKDAATTLFTFVISSLSFELLSCSICNVADGSFGKEKTWHSELPHRTHLLVLISRSSSITPTPFDLLNLFVSETQIRGLLCRVPSRSRCSFRRYMYIYSLIPEWPQAVRPIRLR